MFAIALYDFDRNELYLMRDRSGVKPLYYYVTDHTIVFASELKPILAYPYFEKEINANALGCFLSKKYIAGPETIFENVYKLEPGCCLQWKTGVTQIHPYWSIENILQKQDIFQGTYEEACDELQNLVRDSVRLRMISDVPVGCFLSGGYDSTLIAAVMQEQSEKKIQTFTIGFDEAAYDESQYAQQVAEAIGTEHTCAYLPLSRAREYIEKIPEYYDEPMADESQIATMLLSQITKNQVTVALSGDAGDELFCGYIRYNELHQFYRMRYIGYLFSDINHVLPVKGWMPRKLNKMMYFDSYEHIIHADFLTYWDRYRKLIGSIPSCREDAALIQSIEQPEMKYMVSDMKTYLPDDILTKVDRASMSVSLESRTPLLDYRIIEFALNLPLEYKYLSGNKKRILKDIAYRYVNKELLDRPKKGFGVPVKKWLRDDWNGMTRGLLEEAYVKKQGLFNPAEINKMKLQFHRGKDIKAGEYLWNLLVFQMWWERWI